MNDINKEEKIVMVNYTKEQKEFYQNMMEEIGNHEDFGKRNPVDIGIDCGYSEEDVTEMIQMCQSEVQDEVKNKIQNDKEAEIYYFMLRKQELRYIVSVNINNWKIEVVKELGKANVSRFGIAYDTFVWILKENEKVVFWENFRTGESGEILLDFMLTCTDRGIFVIEDGIIVESRSSMSLFASLSWIKLGFDKSVKKIKREITGCLLDGGNKIYCIDISYGTGGIYSISKDLEGEFREECRSCSSYQEAEGTTESLTFCEVGIDNGEPFGYSFYEKYASKGWFDTRITRVKEKLTLKGFKKIRGHQVVKYSGGSILSDFLVRDFTTEHYQLLGEYIYTKDDGENLNKVCSFPRMLHSIQGATVYSRDVFIGITEMGDRDETAIIKIDMRKEREAVVLPLEFSEK
jgi:hypothetical protein